VRLPTLFTSPNDLYQIGDARKLYNDHKVKAQNLVELSWLARQADTKLQSGGTEVNRKLISLQRLTQTYLEKYLPKDENRTSNWEAALSETQLECE
jgi:hypothetical protein